MESEMEAQRIVTGSVVIQELLQCCYNADGVNSFKNVLLQFVLSCIEFFRWEFRAAQSTSGRAEGYSSVSRG